MQVRASSKFIGCCYLELWTQVQNVHDNQLLIPHHNDVWHNVVDETMKHQKISLLPRGIGLWSRFSHCFIMGETIINNVFLRKDLLSCLLASKKCASQTKLCCYGAEELPSSSMVSITSLGIEGRRLVAIDTSDTFFSLLQMILQIWSSCQIGGTFWEEHQ